MTLVRWPNKGCAVLLRLANGKRILQVASTFTATQSEVPYEPPSSKRAFWKKWDLFCTRR